VRIAEEALTLTEFRHVARILLKEYLHGISSENYSPHLMVCNAEFDLNSIVKPICPRLVAY
jgi:hypothetical protein